MPPGAFNPVGAVASTPGVSQSKSFRTRLGFGGSVGGGGLSTKPSFFSQLKPGRKSLGGPDLRPLEHPILVIDPEPEHQRMQQATADNRVVLNEETEPDRPLQSPVKCKTGSPSKHSFSPSSLPRSKLTASHSVPASPFDNHASVRPLSLEPSHIATKAQLDPDESGISKHLPDLSTDLSLLVNEPPPDTMSQSDFHKSQVSPSDAQGVNAASLKGGGAIIPIPGSSPAALENYDHTERWGIHELASAARSVVSSPPGVRQDGIEPSETAISGLTNGAVENASTSFDLSSAKLSLDLMRRSIGEEWGRNLVIDGSGSTSAMLIPPEQSLMESVSGPVTSTPCLSPAALPSQPQADIDISFDLDALDPDLVALLRPNTYKQGSTSMKRIVTPSPLEPFAPPADPLNPGTTAQRSPSPLASPPALSSSHRVQDEADKPASSPARKYATLSSSISPARPLRLPRSYTVQDIVPPSRAVKTSPTEILLDLPRLQTPAHDSVQHVASSTTTTTSSETGTPSDASKQPSPLSAPPLTLDDLDRTHGASPSQWSGGVSTSTSHNVTMRRYTRATQFQSPRPGSVLTSSTDSRPTPRYAPRERDRELRPGSTLASPGSPGPSTRAFGSIGRERERGRPSIDGLFPAHFSPEGSAGCPNSIGSTRQGPNANDMYSNPKENKWEMSVERRYRKRSMSLDQSGGFERGGDERFRHGGMYTRLRVHGGRDRLADSASYGGSEFGGEARGGLGAPYDARERDRERYGYESGYGERERYGRPHTDWLGPRTAKAFAAAGLLDDPRETSGPRYGTFSRSASERDFRNAALGGVHERVSPGNGGFSVMDGERDKGNFRYNFASSVRSGSDRESRPRTDAESPSTLSGTRPPSRGESWSHNRPAPLFARTMSDLMSQRGSADGRESVSGIHPRTGSAYSGGAGGTGGGSAGSGGGRASPTTTSSLAVVQSQIQSLKDKHDAQTEALLAALADSQRTSRELREENEKLKVQVRTLEERLVDTIASSKQKEREIVRTMRMQQRPHAPEPTRVLPSRRDPEIPHLRGPQQPPKSLSRSTPSPTKRRLSTSSSVFPIVPGSMSLLMAETPGSPPQGSLGSSSSRPPSPTLVLPKVTSKPKSPERRDTNGHHAKPLAVPQPIPKSHKRSTSEVSMATSANFSFDTGSPGSLKLKPEHERLLGDMTRLSLITGFGGDSESEG